MTMTKKQVPPKSKRGPRVLEYLPEQFKHVLGIQGVTTVSQLQRLKQYIETPVTERSPFVRLGCSVTHDRGEDGKVLPSTSTWAVTVNEQVEVLVKQGDPRSYFKWMAHAARPWNIQSDFTPTDRSAVAVSTVPVESASGEETPTDAAEIGKTDGNIHNYIVMVDGENQYTSESILERIHEAGVVSADVIDQGEEHPFQYRVCGRPGWWITPELDDLFILVTEVENLVPIPYKGNDSNPAIFFVPFASWAHTYLSQCQEIDRHPLEILREEVQAQIWNRLAIVYFHLLDTPEHHEKLRTRIKETVADKNLMDVRERDIRSWSEDVASDFTLHANQKVAEV